MARVARAEIFDPSEIAIVHVINRCVRRCFLMGDDPFSGKNYDHRKGWLEERLEWLAAHFGIELLCYSILSNHFHLILRSRPDVVATWDDSEVARRWLMICPVRKNTLGEAEVPTECELNSIRNDPIKLARVRSKLSDISWWMRILTQPIAARANREEKLTGRFWQGRFHAVLLCDETALLACAAYVDLNPIRAAMAETLERSDFTSIQRRIQSRQAEVGSPAQPESAHCDAQSPDRSLARLPIDELHDEVGPVASRSDYRASDKGFLSMSIEDYIELLDWTARQIVPGKAGSTPTDVPNVLKRLKIDKSDWETLVQSFDKLFYLVAGRATTLQKRKGRLSQRPFHHPRRIRELASLAA